MQWDNNVLEEDYVFVTKRHCKTRDDTRQNVEELSSTVKFVSLVDKSEEALVDSLTDHLSAGHKLGVELMQDVLKVISLDRLFGVKELKELLHELGSNIHFQRSNLNGFVDNQLQEELVDTLEMRPSGLNLIFLLYTSLGELQVGLLEVRKRSENVLLNHSHDVVQVRNDERNDGLLILKHLLDFINGVQSFGLSLDVLRLIFVVVVLLANEKFLLKRLFGVLVCSSTCLSVRASIASCSLRSGSSCGCLARL